MADTPLPSMRIIYFSNQPPEIVNAVIEGLEALGQEVLLLVTTPGPLARPGTEYKRTVANARRDLDILVTNHMSRLAAMLRSLEPDLIFTTGFSWKLPPERTTPGEHQCPSLAPATISRTKPALLALHK